MKMRRRWNRWKIAVFLLVIFSSIFFVSNEAWAINTSYEKKAEANNLRQCYDNVLKGDYSLTLSETTNKWNIKDIFTNNFEEKNLIRPGVTKTGNTEELTESCYQYFDGKLTDWFGAEEAPKEVFGVEKFLVNKLGYTKTEKGGNDVVKDACYNANVSIGQENVGTVATICWPANVADGTANYTSPTIENKDSRIQIGAERFILKFVFGNDSNGTCEIRLPNNGSGLIREQMDEGHLFANCYGPEKWDDKKAEFYNEERTVKLVYEPRDHQTSTYFELGNISNAYNKARKEWLGQNSDGPVPFTAAEIIELYLSYIQDNSEIQFESDNCVEKISAKDGYVYKYNGKWCKINTERSIGLENYKYAGFVRSGRSKYYYLNTFFTFNELIDQLVKWVEENPDATEEAAKDVDDNKKEPTENDLCYANAGSMGWILCPAIVITSQVGQWMYDRAQDQLQFNSSIFSDGGVERGWNEMRDIANVIFVILFLIVIFSQLTGVGIDNYGIKRILPKLIVVAILVNLSLILCKIAVDISNILGAGLKELLSGVTPVSGDWTGDATPDMAFGGAAGLTIAGFLVAGLYKWIKQISLKEMAMGAILGIFGIIIVVVVSVLVLFIILMIRQAGIIMLVVLSPVAVVCYALPNTEKIFKKWSELFKALLLVYPICGAMVGAGTFASGVLRGSAPVAAMIIRVVPYFFIPLVLKNSLSAMGNLGGKLSALGRGLGRKGSSAATGAVKNFDRYKDWSQAQNRMASMRREKRRIENYKKKGNLTDAQKAALGRAQARLAAAESQQEKDFSSVFDRQDRGEVVNEVNRALSGNNVPLAGASIDAALAKGAEDNVMEALYNRDFNGLSNDMQHRILQSLNSSNSEVLKAYAKYRQTGGRGNLKDWMNGTNTDRNADGIKSGSLANHLKERGIGAMNDLSRDALKFMNDKGVGVKLSNSLGSDYSKMLGNASINARDPRAKAEIERMIGEALANGGSIKDFGFTASSLGSMRADTLEAIRNGYMKGGMSQTDAENKIRSELANEIAAAKNDNFIRNKMDSTVRDFLLDGGQLPPPSTQPQSQNPPDIQGPQ